MMKFFRLFKRQTAVSKITTVGTRTETQAPVLVRSEDEVEIYGGVGIPFIRNRSDPKSNQNMTRDENRWMSKNWGKCPDCGSQLFEGPEGGGSQNCPCSNPECRSEFNVNGFANERNGKMTEERRKWYGIPDVSIAMSTFARERHLPDNGYSFFKGNEDELIQLVNANWNNRTPGDGRKDLSQVVLVPVSPGQFVGTTVKLRPTLVLEAGIGQRQEGEDLFVRTMAVGEIFHSQVISHRWDSKAIQPVNPEPVNFVKIVLYSAKTLLENNGNRSSDADWEIVAIIASEVENEPMFPLAMARNFLEKNGGTFAQYDAKQFAEAIYYWSNRVSVKSR